MDNEHLIRSPEKRAIVEMVNKKYNQVITDLRETETKEMSEMVNIIAERLKVGILFARIKHLDQEKARIEKTIEELGFRHSYGSIQGLNEKWVKNENIPDYTTPAGRLYYKLTKARPDIRSLESKRDKDITDVWLCTTKTEARSILETKIAVEVKPLRAIAASIK